MNLVPLALSLSLACTARRELSASINPPHKTAAHQTKVRELTLDPPEAISLLGKPLRVRVEDQEFPKLRQDLMNAQAALSADPTNPEKIVWVGRRLGYLWRMQEAIEVYSDGIAKFPNYAPLYRHRGHRYISIRQFEKAVVDLEKAVKLTQGKPDDVEQDGQPNAENLPLTTLGFNVWYHLGVAQFLLGHDPKALQTFQETMKFTRGYDDNVVAVTDWMVLVLQRMGRHEEANALLQPIHPKMRIIENMSYHKRLLMYKGLIQPDDLLRGEKEETLDFATLGFGVGFWCLHHGQPVTGRRILEQVVNGPHWPAFGHIAAEVELTKERLRDQPTLPMKKPDQGR
ncbi:MAG: hypothetical protein AABZ47_07040 [Planctomycetota bacterium]